MKFTILFILLLVGATAPIQAHWYQRLKALQEAAQLAQPAMVSPPETERTCPVI